MMAFPVLYGSLLLLVTALLAHSYKRRKAYLLPPGPKGWSVVGNAFDIPVESMGPVYKSWTRKFNSEIVSASVFGTRVVVLNSFDDAVELLDKRAVKYSSRPRAVMTCELLGFEGQFPLIPNNEAWRDRRKYFVKYFRPGADGASVHTPLAHEFVARFLQELSETPNEFQTIVRHMVGGLVLSFTYGIPIERKHDPLVEFMDSMGRVLDEQFIPGKYLVEVIPALKYVPAWFPGAGFKRLANRYRWMSTTLKMEPYEKAVKAFGSDVRPSFLSDALASLDAAGMSEDDRLKELNTIQEVASATFGTAADTTSDAINTFIFALATHPEVRKGVQDELDALLCDQSGVLRLPTYEDEEKLPLLTAATMESQRWAPVTPIGLPHRSTEDDVYKGWFIPKGTVVMANQWSMLNNEKVYGPDPHSFNPDRFIHRKWAEDCRPGEPAAEIDKSIPHPNTIAFGFGRRVCPGSHIAQSTLWYTAASLLTIFDFKAPAEAKANYIGTDGKVDRSFSAGFLSSQPRPFKCEFEVRSPEAAAVLADLGMGL